MTVAKVVLYLILNGSLFLLGWLLYWWFIKAAVKSSMNDISKAPSKWFKTMLKNDDFVARLKKIKLIITDVDGSLTDSTVLYNEAGEADRAYSTQDGYGMRMALDSGLQISFLSGNAGSSIVSRTKKLQIPENLIILGSKDKRIAVKTLREAAGATSEQTLVFGDDLLDAAVKEADPAIIFAMPKNALFYLKHTADCIVPVDAGKNGALRLLIDLVLYAQGKHLGQQFIDQALRK